MIHIVKGFSIVNETEVDVFFWNSLAFSVTQWMLLIWSLVSLPVLNPVCISGSSRFPLLLKPSLKGLERYLASTWNENNCVVVWIFFGIAFLFNWDENWPFPIFWPLLSFLNLLAYPEPFFMVEIFPITQVFRVWRKNVERLCHTLCLNSWFIFAKLWLVTDGSLINSCTMLNKLSEFWKTISAKEYLGVQ